MAQIINPFLFTGASLLDGGWWQRSRCCDGAGSGNKAHFMDRDILKEIANVSIKAGEEEYILVVVVTPLILYIYIAYILI